MTYKISDKLQLEDFITTHWNEINHYIDTLMKELPIPIYSSVDVRESKIKFAPVDHNMYPAGFNNLCTWDLQQTSKLFKEAIGDVANIAIIVESHTKNTFYLDHLHSLRSSLEHAGYKTRFISFDNDLFESQDKIELTSYSGHPIAIYKSRVDSDQITLNSTESPFNVDIAILNNDQSSPIPIPWDQLKTPVYPTPKIGWFKRQKINHFKAYHKVVMDFCAQYDIDPTLIEAQFDSAENIDFQSKAGIDELAEKVQKLLSKLPPETSVFMKASQGTYGMGIQVVSSAEEVLNMNRKTRNKMDIGKSGIKFTSILIQEGVETVLKYDDGPAEVTIYLVNGQACGGFMRTNPLKDSKGNLNSKGMIYRKFCISEIRENNEYQAKEAVYSIIARLATVASGYEIKDVL